MRYLFSLALGCFAMLAQAQVQGKVVGLLQGERVPLPGATVNWQGTNVYAVTDSLGSFQIDLNPETGLLTASFVGFAPVTKVVTAAGAIIFELSERTLKEVEIIERIQATTVQVRSVGLTLELGKKELAKAACCNLSESFETNASIDVAFTDAITGTRQIELLGLAGKYAQLQTEMIPFGRGLFSNLALAYVPGTWIESIQISKGVGSVANGFESMSGQINLELMKPWEAPKSLFNMYLAENGRTELNLVHNIKVGKKWHTGILAHANVRPFAMDRNGNGFMDMPKGNQINVVNRWKYQGIKGWEAQLYARALGDVSQSGQTNFDFGKPQAAQSPWGSEIRATRFEAMGKLGYVFPQATYRSFGLIGSVSQNNLQSFFGNNTFNANQFSGYFNGIFHSIIGTTAHQYTVGASFMFDRYLKDAHLPLSFVHATTERVELVPGAFGEYTWMPNDAITAVAGLRGDYHNTLGWKATPRLHVRYAFDAANTLRIGAGTGWRTPHALVEQISVLATNRTVVWPTTFAAMETAPMAEVSRNVGASWVSNFRLNYRKGQLVVDYYYTDFTNQLVADWDVNAQTLAFYALDGKSFSHAFTTTVDYELAPRLDVRMAYKYLDARTDFQTGLLQRPLIPVHRGLLNLAYETRKGWKFDLTGNYFGSRRIPVTNLDAMPTQSPAVWMVHAQINKQVNARLDMYLGAENLTNFKQQQPILGAATPFEPGFDSSLIWGPIFGRMAYLGLNYRLD